MTRPRPAPALSLAVCPIVALQLSKIPLHSPLSSAPGLLMRLRDTSEWGVTGTRRGERGETGGVGGRETCVYRKRTFPLAMSIAYCQRRTRTDAPPPPPPTHEYCPRPTRLSSGSTLARACIQTKKLAIYPAFTLRACYVALLAPSKFLTLPPFLPSFFLSFLPSLLAPF